jgi:hypothetical protein
LAEISTRKATRRGSSRFGKLRDKVQVLPHQPLS